MKRDAAYCYLTLCPVLEWLGEKCDDSDRWPHRLIDRVAWWAWFKLHHNRFYYWLLPGPL